jgi:hypothetical protein
MPPNKRPNAQHGIVPYRWMAGRQCQTKFCLKWQRQVYQYSLYVHSFIIPVLIVLPILIHFAPYCVDKSRLPARAYSTVPVISHLVLSANKHIIESDVWFEGRWRSCSRSSLSCWAFGVFARQAYRHLARVRDHWPVYRMPHLAGDERLDYGYEKGWFLLSPGFVRILNPIHLFSLEFFFRWSFKQANKMLQPDA